MSGPCPTNPPPIFGVHLQPEDRVSGGLLRWLPPLSPTSAASAASAPLRVDRRSLCRPLLPCLGGPIPAGHRSRRLAGSSGGMRRNGRKKDVTGGGGWVRATGCDTKEGRKPHRRCEAEERVVWWRGFGMCMGGGPVLMVFGGVFIGSDWSRI